jgi:protein TonB
MVFPAAHYQQRPALLLLVGLAHAVLLWCLVHAGGTSKPEKPLIMPRVTGRLVAESAPTPRRQTAPASTVRQPREKPQKKPEPIRQAPAVIPRPDPSRTAKPAPAPTAPAQSTVASHTPATGMPAPHQQSEAAPKGSPGPVQLPVNRASGLDNPLPVYPEMSRRLGEEGVVRLSVMIQADGRVTEVSVLKSSGSSRLDAAAIAAVRRWHYLPARRNGEAIAWRHTQPVAFSLNN